MSLIPANIADMYKTMFATLQTKTYRPLYIASRKAILMNWVRTPKRGKMCPKEGLQN
ncbi:MAG TPA: hypothetical protein VGQ53_18500 [Chitinophagaceae bacterium]|nr:hypothetical protein [Chitinophagaceae bacterium]